MDNKFPPDFPDPANEQIREEYEKAFGKRPPKKHSIDTGLTLIELAVIIVTITAILVLLAKI